MNDIQRQETISFRFIGLSREMVPFLKAALGGVELEAKALDAGRGEVVAFVLSEGKDYKELIKFIEKWQIDPSTYGLWISLVTESDNDGVHVPTYAVELLRQVGGQLDFSFVSV